jgi:hypothetical protein
LISWKITLHSLPQELLLLSTHSSSHNQYVTGVVRMRTFFQ